MVNKYLVDTMDLQWTYYSLIALMSTFVAIVLIYVILKRKRTPMSISFCVLMFSLLIWSLTEFLHIMFTDLDTILLFSKLSYFGISFAPPFWLIFSLYYGSREKYMNRTNVALLLFIPVMTLLFVFTNDLHSLIWRNIELSSSGSIVYYVKDYGPWFYIFTFYSYILLAMGIYFVVDPFSFNSSIYRNQKVILLLALLVPWASNIIFIGFGPKIYSMDFTPLSFVITCCIMLFSIYNFDFLKIVPIANKIIIENINDAIIVTDNAYRIVHLNDSAKSMLKLDGKDIYGEKIDDHTPMWKELNASIHTPSKEVKNFIEMVEGNYYLCSLSDLYQNDIMIGNLLMIKDITKEKISEYRINKLNEHLELVNKILSHDISNNLTIANSLLDLMDVNYIEYKDKAKKSITKSMELISRMKDLDGSFNTQSKLSKYRISEILEKTIENFENIDFNLTGDCHVLANEAILSIFDNIISNAIVHGKTKKIDVVVDVEGSFAMVNIIDYGVGIPDDVIGNVFEYGYSHGENKGTGYGLFIAKKIMELYGGDISVKNNKPHGTVFTLKFIVWC